ncbi:hypothetical protein [Devosia sp. CN2-171]|uniref:hypothetical protein n=1 Tax=Devosia sp. CN2-171 TaxID=3400909 RepID=UPI003BF886C2
MLKQSLFFAALAGLLATPVLAQDEAVDSFVLPAFNGIAVSQAAEAGLGVCFGPLQPDTSQCATSACMQQSGLGEEDCATNLWCYPHGWVADIFMQHSEGPHWHKFVCDQQDRASLEAVVQLECAKEYLSACEIVRVWDNDGQQVFGEGADPQLPTAEELERGTAPVPVQ